MPEKTVKMLWYTYRDEDDVPQTANQGDTIDISDDEAKRGDSLGAFEDSPPREQNEVETYFGASPEHDVESGVPHGQPPEVSDEAKEPSDEIPELDTDNQPDATTEGYPEEADKDSEGQEQAQPAASSQQPPQTPQKGRQRQAQPEQQA